jgi:hypothetical protein
VRGDGGTPYRYLPNRVCPLFFIIASADDDEWQFNTVRSHAPRQSHVRDTSVYDVIYNIPTRDRSDEIPTVAASNFEHSLNSAATERDEGRNAHSRGSSFVHNREREEEEVMDMGTVRQIVYPPRVESNPTSRDDRSVSATMETIRLSSHVRHGSFGMSTIRRNPSSPIRHSMNPSDGVEERNKEVLLDDTLRPLDIDAGEKDTLEREMREKLRFGRGLLESLIKSI